MSNVTNPPEFGDNPNAAIDRMRAERVARRRERLGRAISEAKTAVLETHQALGDRMTYEAAVQYATKTIRSRKSNGSAAGSTVGISPILITIIIQLLPILIKWFIDHRSGFARDIDNVSRDISYATSRCVTRQDFQNYRSTVERDYQAAMTNGAQETDAGNAARVMAIAGIVRVLEGFLSWWTK